VQAQSFADCVHYLVVDGPEHADRVSRIVQNASANSKPVKIFQLPEPTGKNDWICHRIYGAMPFLVNSKWVSFLDDDNWYDPNHLQSLMDACCAMQTSWGFALRKIYDSAGNFVCLDQCESLGSLHPIFTTDSVRLVDTNCYLLDRELAIQHCPVWNRPRNPVGKLKADFALCMSLIRSNIPPVTTAQYTVNYVVADQITGPKLQYFLHGNAAMRRRYPNGLPWEPPAK
jgi:hypothetical protein